MHTFKKILVPTDFSRPADYAVLYAANLAHFTGAELTLYHSFIPFASGFYPETQSRQENQTLEQQLRFRLSHMQDLLKKSHKNVKIKTFVDRGAFSVGIKEYCRTNQIDLVVMGTKGASGLKEVMLGSYTADLIQDAPCPVIAIPAQWQFKKPARIALAVTYKAQDLYALRTLLDLNTHFGAEISMLHVHDPDDQSTAGGPLPVTPKDLEKEAGETTLHFKTIRSNKILDALIDTAFEDKTDMLVISPRKREKVWERLFDRNLSKSAVCHIRIPIMAVPPAPGTIGTSEKQQ